MRFGIFIPVAFAAATTLAGGGGWSGMAVAASDAPVQAHPENPSRDHQNDNSTAGAHRSGTTPTDQDKPLNHCHRPVCRHVRHLHGTDKSQQSGPRIEIAGR